MMFISKYIPPCYRIKPGKFIYFVTSETKGANYTKRKVRSIDEDKDHITKCKYGCIVVIGHKHNMKLWVSPMDILGGVCLKCIYNLRCIYKEMPQCEVECDRVK